MQARTSGILGAVVAVALLPGCGSNPGAPTLDGNPDLFAAEVQPILTARCSYLGCHGREGMPLTLYAVDFLRLRDPEGVIDPSLPELDELALTPMEIDLNRRALAARAGPEDPGGDKLIRRMLPPESGGISHAGVVVFQTEDDPRVEVLRRFFATVREQ